MLNHFFLNFNVLYFFVWGVSTVTRTPLSLVDMCVYIYTYMCIYICTFMHKCVYIYVDIHIYIYTYIRIYTYIYTYIYTCL
jgi:hypothetical protein